MRVLPTSRASTAAATLAALGCALAVAVALAALPASAQRAPRRAAHCTPGARTLARPGAVLYPEVGNGGYDSVHTDVDLVYDANRNRFLHGTEVDQTVRAAQCLSELSFDFERFTAYDPDGSPHLRVDSVEVDGEPARFRFVQPTYPGDPHGPEDPDPRAHEASQYNPVGGPDHNPLPPACAPELIIPRINSRNGSQCPANKLVITPARPIAAGATAKVAIAYSGEPGIHYAADGSTEGWYRTRGGSAMESEPLGSEAWLPLNNFPSAKPTYDFHITSQRGKTAIANGERLGVKKNPPSKAFPQGSATTTWHAPYPIASYLPVAMVGDYTLRRRTIDGIVYYQAQDRHIGRRRRSHNRAIMDLHPYMTRFESRFNGPYPFASDGVVVIVPGTPDAEESQTMISFTGGKARFGFVDRATLFHETMHQWWGDNVSEGGFEMAFFKEGLATLSEELVRAEHARIQGGRPAFERKLVTQFDQLYARSEGFWSPAPSATSSYTYLDDNAVYQRPSAAYIALRAILGPHRFNRVLRGIQRRYGGGSLQEPQLEAAFAARLPNPSPACRARLRGFFTQWFDTAYPKGGAVRPRITGPGLAGEDFYAAGCRR